METYWFVDSFYHKSGAPKMERQLMDYIRRWKHHVLSSEDLDTLVHGLLKVQEEYLSSSSRCKPVIISRSGIVPSINLSKAFVYIYIGTSTVTLTRVENSGEISLGHIEQEG